MTVLKSAVQSVEMKHAFILGSPRSGTTWLQMMLSEHPEVASGPETHAFSRYATNISGIIRYDLATPSFHGVAKIIGEDKVLAICKDLADECFAKFLESTPDATIVLEKTPSHIRCYDLILKFYPDAYIIHAVRDPRAVAASMRAASRTGWGRSWAPADVIDAAKLWLADIRLGPEIGKATDRYEVVKYEELHSDGPQTLKRIFDLIGADSTLELCHDIAESLRLDRVKKKVLPDQSANQEQARPDFFREGKTDTWRTELTPSEVRAIEYICRDEMQAYGYPLTTSNRSKPFRVRSHAFRQSLKRRLKKVSKKIENRL